MAHAILSPQRRQNIEHQSRTRKVRGKYLELKFIEDNSAPCAFCFFLKDLKCTFPKDRYKKECSHERGTHKGWNTHEYVELELKRIKK